MQSKALSRVSTVQHHSSKASIPQCSVFFIVHLSNPCMTTGQTKALTRWTFVGKVMSLLFIMLPRLVITFLPKSKHLLISWLQSLSAGILEPPKIKSVTVSIVSPSICHSLVNQISWSVAPCFCCYSKVKLFLAMTVHKYLLGFEFIAGMISDGTSPLF